MSITHFSAPIMAATFQLTNVMVAGLQAAVQTGYNQTGLGSLTPEQIKANDCLDLRHLTASDTFQIQIFSFLELGQSFFGHCLFKSTDGNWDGVNAITAQASSYSFGGSTNTWNWNAPFSPAEFINGQSYDLEIV